MTDAPRARVVADRMRIVRDVLARYYRHGIRQNAVNEEYDARALLAELDTVSAGTADAPDAGGDLRAWLDERIAGHDRSLRYCPPGAVRAHEMTAAALREVRDRLPAPDPAPARLPPGQKLTVGNLTTRPMSVSPEIEAAAEAEWAEVQKAMRPPDAITGSVPATDDPEGAEAVELAPDSATAREAGPAAGGA